MLAGRTWFASAVAVSILVLISIYLWASSRPSQHQAIKALERFGAQISHEEIPWKEPAKQNVSMPESVAQDVLLDIRHLRFAGNQHIDEQISLAQHLRIVAVDFDHPEVIDDARFTRILGIQGIKEIDAHGVQISDRGVQGIERSQTLRGLWLAGTKISDSAVQRIAECQGLEYLDLSGTQISNAAIRSISALPRLRKLRLAATNISDECAPDLARIASLNYIDLRSTKVTASTIHQLERSGTVWVDK